MDNGPVITIAFPGSGLPACVTIPGLLVKRDRVPGHPECGGGNKPKEPKGKNRAGKRSPAHFLIIKRSENSILIFVLVLRPDILIAGGLRLVFIDVPYITAGIPFLEFPFPRVIVVPALSVFRKAFIAPVPCTVSYAFSHQVSPCSAHVPVNLKSILLFRVKNFLADPGKNGLRPPATFSRPACGRYGARYKSTSVRAA